MTNTCHCYDHGDHDPSSSCKYSNGGRKCVDSNPISPSV